MVIAPFWAFANDPFTPELDREVDQMTRNPGHGQVWPLISSAMLASLLSAQPVLAQEPPGKTGAATRQEEPEEERRNEVALVVAGTWDAAEDETFLTLGVEYERRITSRFGFIAEVEYLFDAERWIVAAPLAFRPARGLKLFAGPGFERASIEDESHESETAETSEGSDTHFLFRVGAAYAHEFAERYSIGPTFSLDFIREHEWNHALVFGVTFGIAF